MAQKSTQNSFYADEIDLREIIKILIESKKLIISSVLFFTIVASIYSHFQKSEFKTSALIEIGQLNRIEIGQNISSHNEINLIEAPESLIRFLRINEIKINKNTDTDTDTDKELSLKALEGSLISMEITSISPERDRELLNQHISKIKERHLEKVNSASKLLISKIDIIKDRIYLLNSEFKDLEQPNDGYYAVLFQLESEIENLTEQLDWLNNSADQKTKLIGDVKSINIERKSSLIIILGFILGLMAGIFMVFTNNFIKSFRQYPK